MLRGAAERNARAQMAQCPDTAHVGAARAPNGTASLPTTTRVAGNAVPAGGTTTREVHWEGSRFRPLHR